MRGTSNFFDPGFRIEVATTCDLDSAGQPVPRTVRLSGARGFDWSDENVNPGRAWDLCATYTDDLGDEAVTGPLTHFTGLQLFGFNDARPRPLTKTWGLTADGIPVASGRLRIWVRRLQSERYVDIYDTDFDRYVNICINGGHQVYASGGHLYCSVQVRAALTRVTAQLG